MMIDPVRSYFEEFREAFCQSVAPDGTTVIRTPHHYLNGDGIEVAIWNERGETYLSDRGRLLDALSLVGADPLEHSSTVERIEAAIRRHGIIFENGVLLAPAVEDLGRGIQRLVQAIIDAQVVGFEERRPTSPEPYVFEAVRDVLETHQARYREQSHIGGIVGRRYPVDFRFAVASSSRLIRAVVVVGTRHNTLAFAERWNFRFRDIRQRHTTLKRLVVLGADSPWTADSQRTLEPECEGIFTADPSGLSEDFVEALLEAS